MDPIKAVIEIAASFFGTLGFGVLFNIRGKKLIVGAIGGLLSWALFLGLGYIFKGEAFRYFLVAIATTVYSEIMARKLKTPASTFCIVTLIPLVPGGALYYTMTYALRGNFSAFISKAFYTVELAVALSLGIVIVISIDKYLSYIINRQRAKKNGA